MTQKKHHATRRWPGGLTSEEIARYAWESLSCPDCGAAPKSACVPLPEPPRRVCKGRFAAAAIELKHQRKTASPSREALEASVRLDLATERGVFMADIPAADVAARIAQNPKGTSG